VAVVGYARISTREQDTRSQEAMLRKAGASPVFVDHSDSSHRKNRPQWAACLDFLREGDTLVVHTLDRLAGTTSMAITTISELHDRGINIKSLTEPEIDTTTPMGPTLFRFVTILTQLRANTIRENTHAGLAHARAEGRVGGRPTVMLPELVDQATRMRANGMSLASIARTLGVGASSVSRALAKQNDQPPEQSHITEHIHT
jgi:DNA invertase Pin-like site-specific DNA recombinase